MRFARTLLLLSVAVCVVAAGASASTVHGFRDGRAPQEAARILNSLPNVDGMRCHWKIKGHTIGCVGLVRAATVQVFLWSGGRRVLYHVCEAGMCGATVKAVHVFGRPY